MPTIRVDDATIGYAIEGPADGGGVPLLLVHGTTMDRTAWDMVRPAMQGDTYTYVMVDLPGSGESSMPTGPLTVEGLVEQLLALMTHVGHETFHVAGYSLGAVLALATAALAPERVLSITSLCGWAVADARMRITFELWKRLIATDPQLFTRYAMADGFTVGGLAMIEPMLEAVLPISAGALAEGSAAHLDLDISLDISALLPAITTPCLLIGAVQDRWVDIVHSRDLHDAIASSSLHELDAGHLVIQELAVEVAELIDRHITRAGPGSLDLDGEGS